MRFAVMHDRPINPTSQRMMAITTLCFLAVLGNILGPGAFWHVSPGWGERLMFVACGVLVAQACLLAIWCGLGQQAIKYRLPITLSLLLLGACAYNLGLQLPETGFGGGLPIEVALMIVGAGFGTFTLLQVPLWLVRRATGTRITTRDAARTEESIAGSQFSIGYLLLWTTFAGVLLVIVRNTLPEDSSPPPQRVLFELITLMLVYIGLSAFLSIPCVWIALADKPPRSAVLLLIGSLLVGPLFILACTNAIFRSIQKGELLTGVISFEIGLAGTTLAALFLLRRFGYRVLVVAGADSERAAADDSSFPGLPMGQGPRE